MVVHDMPQHDNRIELDEKVEDAWGLPAARVTLTPHQNDLDMGRFLIDRNAEILEAGGAKKVYRVYIDNVTGNCSHQHGTTRMGDDPDTSGAQPVVPGPRRGQPLRRRRRPVPDRHRGEPHAHDHGERVAGGRAHRDAVARPVADGDVTPEPLVLVLGFLA
jgi:GMC oxidoreductase.